MQKKYLFMLLALVVASLGFLFFRNQYFIEEPITIQSADGVLTLEISPGSLPKNVSTSDIAITPLAAEEFFGNKEQAPGPAYELLPDGLVFTSPVTLRVITDVQSSGVIPQVLHVSGDNVELLEPSGVRIYAESARVETDFPIEHFSRIGIDSLHGVFTYEFTAGGTAAVGESLPYNLTIQADTHTHAYYSGLGFTAEYTSMTWEERDRRSQEEGGRVGFLYGVVPGSSYTVSKFVIKDPQAILMPPRLDVPAGTHLVDEAYGFETELTCTAVGKTNLSFASINIAYQMWQQRGDGRKTTIPRETAVFLFADDPYECTPADSHEATCLLIDEEHYPVMQFRQGEHAGGCEGEHWHADQPVESLEGSVRQDPAPSNCGFGLVSVVPVVPCTIDDDLWERLQK